MIKDCTFSWPFRSRFTATRISNARQELRNRGQPTRRACPPCCERSEFALCSVVLTKALPLLRGGGQSKAIGSHKRTTNRKEERYSRGEILERRSNRIKVVILTQTRRVHMVKSKLSYAAMVRRHRLCRAIAALASFVLASPWNRVYGAADGAELGGRRGV